MLMNKPSAGRFDTASNWSPSALCCFNRPRHPERTVLYRVLFHHFERCVAKHKGLVVASWANYSNRGKGDIGRVARIGEGGVMEMPCCAALRGS